MSDSLMWCTLNTSPTLERLYSEELKKALVPYTAWGRQAPAPEMRSVSRRRADIPTPEKEFSWCTRDEQQGGRMTIQRNCSQPCFGGLVLLGSRRRRFCTPRGMTPSPWGAIPLLPQAKDALLSWSNTCDSSGDCTELRRISKVTKSSKS